MDKKAVLGACKELVEKRLAELQASLDALKSDLETAGKSSAGDKHETARAMMQSEEDKIQVQINEAREQRNTLEKLPFEGSKELVRAGHLIGTDKGLFYLSVSLGKVALGESVLFAVSVDSPIGKSMLNQSVGDVVLMRGVAYRIETII